MERSVELVGDRGRRPQGLADIWGFLDASRHERGSGIRFCGLARADKGPGKLLPRLEGRTGDREPARPPPLCKERQEGV